MDIRTEFAAPLGRPVRIVSVLTVVIVLVVLVILTLAGLKRSSVPAPEVAWVWLLILLILPVTTVFRVSGYRLAADELLIGRLGWTSRVSLSGLCGAEADPEAFSGVVLKAGNGGFLGFVGWFWSRRMGWFRAWATDPARSVCLRFRDRRVVISPDDPEAFLRALRQRGGRVL